MDLEFEENGRTYKEKIILDETKDITEYKLAGKDDGNSILVDHKHVSPYEMEYIVKPTGAFIKYNLKCRFTPFECLTGLVLK